MWRNITPITDAQMSAFEKNFDFRIAQPLREFLIDHNGGAPTPGTFPTTVRERKLEYFLDFSDLSYKGAWGINQRVRKHIGPKMLVIGIDFLGNYVCIQREYKQQEIVLWNHVTNNYEKCLHSIPAFIRTIG